MDFRKWFAPKAQVPSDRPSFEKPPGFDAYMLKAANVIKMAVALKLLAMYRLAYHEETALTLASAVSNKLFASPSPDSRPDDLVLAERLAEDALRTDDEIRYAAVMGCRAWMLCTADKNTDERWRIWDTMQWMASVCPLPPDMADPSLIADLANALHDKYIKKT
jgi:hypothetical protein